MLGVGLRKLCPPDCFGYAFREKKSCPKIDPRGCKSGPRGGPKWPVGGLRTALLSNFAARAVRKLCLGGSGGALGALLAVRGAVLKRLKH